MHSANFLPAVVRKMMFHKLASKVTDALRRLFSANSSAGAMCKLTRNERIKLSATWISGIGLASVVAAVLPQFVSGHPVMFPLAAAGVGLHLIALWILRGMKD
jgi:hypothetical protein